MADLNRFLEKGASALRAGGFACVLGGVVLSPWCFGAWEMWWFWPMACLLFLGALLAGLGGLLSSAFASGPVAPPEAEPRFRFEGRLTVLLLAVAPFLLYAAWRGAQPSAPGIPLVEMEAQRSLLLFATPALLVLTLFLTATRRRIRILALAFLANAVVLAVYAVANHLLTADTYVLWVKTPFNYGARAGGVYFCPNHLAAHMNLALALVGALLLARRTPARVRLGLLLLAAPLLAAWYLTLSRGGTASLLLTLPLLLTAGLRGYPWRARLAVVLAVLLLAAGGLWTFLKVPNPLRTRLETHHLISTLRRECRAPEPDWQKVRKAFFTGFDRGMYIDSALRAWRSNPRIGIGPGQHAIRWPEFAATPDGDRETRKWPTLTNHTYYLYEVHSDWTQLLEEYGTLGLALFLLPCLVVPVLLLRAQGAGLRDEEAPALDQALPLAALFALGAFAVHSVGDFSLQIPALVWSLAALTAAGLLSSLPTRD